MTKASPPPGKGTLIGFSILFLAVLNTAYVEHSTISKLHGLFAGQFCVLPAMVNEITQAVRLNCTKDYFASQ
jgi:ABC-type antimicrobial peptide transport system permease subunit